MKSRSPALAADAVPPGTASGFARRVKALRSMAFFAVAFLWLMVGVGLGVRLLVWPLIALRPSRREAVLGAWIRFHARTFLNLARVLAGVRFAVRGRIAPGPCVMVMNHQSVYDIPLLHAVSPGPYPRIPSRDRYFRWIPGVSPMLRAAQYPKVEQRRDSANTDLAGIAACAELMAAGKTAMAIFPEGHRTRDGEIGPFMVRGLRAMLERAPGIPVYLIVADGMEASRTFAETAVNMAGSRIHARILPPVPAPSDPARVEAFIAGLRERMVQTLAEMRAEGYPVDA